MLSDRMPADELVDMLMKKLLDDMPLAERDRVSVMINGLGATSLEELYIVYRAVQKKLSNIGVSIVMPHVGEYSTSMEMAGMSISIFKLDEELEGLLADEAITPFYTNVNK
mgnify:FL=1